MEQRCSLIFLLLSTFLIKTTICCFITLIMLMTCICLDVIKKLLMDHSPINQNFDLNKSRQNSIIA